MHQYMIVGTYTSGKSEGVYVYDFNSADGSYKEISHVKTSNPSYVAVSPDEKFVFAVNENSNNDNGGEVSSFSFDKTTGTLTPLNKQLTGGDSPCYVDVDHTGKWIFVGMECNMTRASTIRYLHKRRLWSGSERSAGSIKSIYHYFIYAEI